MACTDPVGPALTHIVVTVDWTVAREPGFVDARWQLISYDPDGVIRRGPVMDSGIVGPDGLFTVRYSARCEGDAWGSTGHRIELFGHFEAHEGGPLPECSAWLDPWCTDVTQDSRIQGGLPPEACTMPAVSGSSAPPLPGRSRTSDRASSRSS